MDVVHMRVESTYHSRPVFHVVIIWRIGYDFHSQLQVSPFGCCFDVQIRGCKKKKEDMYQTLNGIIPFQVVLLKISINKTQKDGNSAHGSPVMQVNPLPKRVISGIEGPSIFIEFVWKYQNHFWAIHGRLDGKRILWGVFVNGSVIARQVRYLSRCVDATNVESPLRRWHTLCKMRCQWIPFWTSWLENLRILPVC